MGAKINHAQRAVPVPGRVLASSGPVRVTSAPAGRLQRCGGVTCPPGTCDHDQSTLQRQAEGPALASSAAPSHRGVDFSRTAVLPDLAIGPAGDSYELEADRMAEAVMRTPPAGRMQRYSDSSDQATLQAQGSSPAAPSAQCLVGEVLRGPGQPMDPAARTFMESRFGHDFSHVKIHADARAARSAAAVGALAYTVGTDVVFGSGQYAPDTPAGRKVLAHELTHTVQQTSGGAHGTQARLQRTLGDGHDLTSPRFAGDLLLEAVYDNERVLEDGDRGPAVRTLQQALLDSGMSLPKFGVDGIFGPETKAAVSAFQHASGLTGTDVDGIVGPTTMGWLDQSFSAGPTPAGTTPGATTGCTSIKTVSVDAVSLDGSSRNPVAELERANTIFDQCCVHLSLGGGGSENAARTAEMLGPGEAIAGVGHCGIATAQETALMSGATADFGLSSRIRAFFVATINDGTPAYDFPPFCATGSAAPLQNMAIVSNSASVRGLAHEIGHILLNSDDHPADPANLMSAPATPPGEQLTSAQCATIFANA